MEPTKKTEPKQLTNSARTNLERTKRKNDNLNCMKRTNKARACGNQKNEADGMVRWTMKVAPDQDRGNGEC